MKGTMAQLFELAGYKDYKSLKVNEFVTPKRKIGIYAWEDGKKVLKPIDYLVYKGESKGGYKVVTSKSVFIATGQHLLYNFETGKFDEVSKIYSSNNDFYGLNENGEKEKVFVEKINDTFSVLDMQVGEENHTYFSAGILSHNTFGSQAKALTEFVRRFNIACADTGTTLLWISQERVNMKFGAHLPSASGGEAILYFSSVVCRITKTDDIKGPDGDITGIEMRVRNYKNKCSVPFRDAEGLKLYYKGGFNPEDEYVDFFLKLGIVEQKGAYFKFNDKGEEFSLQGRKKLDEYLKANPDTKKRWEDEVISKLSSFCQELDANNIALDEDGNPLNEKDAEAYNAYLESTSSPKEAASGDEKSD